MLYNESCGEKLSRLGFGCMRLLLSARSENAKILSDRSVSMAQRLKDCLVYNSNLQSAIYGEEPEEFRDNLKKRSGNEEA